MKWSVSKSIRFLTTAGWRRKTVFEQQRRPQTNFSVRSSDIKQCARTKGRTCPCREVMTKLEGENLITWFKHSLLLLIRVSPNRKAKSWFNTEHHMTKGNEQSFERRCWFKRLWASLKHSVDQCQLDCYWLVNCLVIFGKTCCTTTNYKLLLSQVKVDMVRLYSV